jgi:hypothetical protein
MRTSQSTETAAPDRLSDSVTARWMELRDYLECRSRQLSQEVRAYPTPIARCDEQLSWLLEQRDRVHRELREMAAQPASDAQQWLQALDGFLTDSPGAANDQQEAALRARLRAAVARARERR